MNILNPNKVNGIMTVNKTKDEDPSITTGGVRLIENWKASQYAVNRAKAELKAREKDHDENTEALAKWILPGDAKPGEKIAVWYGNQLIQCSLSELRWPTITIRPREPDGN